MNHGYHVLSMLCTHTYTYNSSIKATTYFKLFSCLNNWDYLGEALQWSHCMILVNEYLKLNIKITSNRSSLIELTFECDRARLSSGRHWLSGKRSLPASFSLESIFRFFFFCFFFFQIFLTHPAYEGKTQCQIIAKNFFGRNCLGREISKEIGKLPGDQKEDRSSGSMKE